MADVKTKIGAYAELGVAADKRRRKIFIEEQDVPEDEVFDGLNEQSLDELMVLRSKITMSDTKVGAINKEIAELAKQSLVLSRLRTKGYMDSAIFMRKTNEDHCLLSAAALNLKRMIRCLG